MTDSSRVRILLVEASEEARAEARLALAGEYAVDEAANAADAMLRLSEQEYALLVLGNELPDMPGPELVAMIRRVYGRRAMNVLVVCSAEAAQSGPASAGADACLGRPFHPKDLRDAVARLAGEGGSEGAFVPDAAALLEAFPYPAMVVDAKHRVWLANGSFYDAAGPPHTCFVDCATAMHGQDGIPDGCPLEESKRTGGPAERHIEIQPFGRLRVAVYPLRRTTPDGAEMYLHLTSLDRVDEAVPDATLPLEEPAA